MYTGRGRRNQSFVAVLLSRSRLVKIFQTHDYMHCNVGKTDIFHCKISNSWSVILLGD
ncbi:hypothetical protein Hanom_Chr14g01315701 [Helianthus anomalus]